MNTPTPNTASETPRTDAKCKDYSGPLCTIGEVQFIPSDFARQLERELGEARQEVERLNKVKGSYQERALGFSQQLATLRADRERMRELLAEANKDAEDMLGMIEDYDGMDWGEDGPPFTPCIDELQERIDQRSAALNSTKD